MPENANPHPKPESFRVALVSPQAYQWRLTRTLPQPKKAQQKTPAFLGKTGAFNAAERSRTSTPCGYKNLNLARLPIPPQPLDARHLRKPRPPVKPPAQLYTASHHDHS